MAAEALAYERTGTGIGSDIGAGRSMGTSRGLGVQVCAENKMSWNTCLSEFVLRVGTVAINYVCL